MVRKLEAALLPEFSLTSSLEEMLCQSCRESQETCLACQAGSGLVDGGGGHGTFSTSLCARDMAASIVTGDPRCSWMVFFFHDFTSHKMVVLGYPFDFGNPRPRGTTLNRQMASLETAALTYMA